MDSAQPYEPEPPPKIDMRYSYTDYEIIGPYRTIRRVHFSSEPPSKHIRLIRLSPDRAIVEAGAVVFLLGIITAPDSEFVGRWNLYAAYGKDKSSIFHNRSVDDPGLNLVELWMEVELEDLTIGEQRVFPFSHVNTHAIDDPRPSRWRRGRKRSRWRHSRKRMERELALIFGPNGVTPWEIDGEYDVGEKMDEQPVQNTRQLPDRSQPS